MPKQKRAHRLGERFVFGISRTAVQHVPDEPRVNIECLYPLVAEDRVADVIRLNIQR